MRKLIILASSLLALAIPTAAMANVAVEENGVGFVGKGDVQNALGLKNDAAHAGLVQEGRHQVHPQRSSTVKGPRRGPAPTAPSSITLQHRQPNIS